MPRCEDYIEHISAAIDGELSPQETARLEEHLAHCPACQALMGDLAALHTQLGALPPVEVPKNLKEDILAAVHDSKVTPLPTKKNFYYKKWMASAAALAGILSLLTSVAGLPEVERVQPEGAQSDAPGL